MNKIHVAISFLAGVIRTFKKKGKKMKFKTLFKKTNIAATSVMLCFGVFGCANTDSLSEAKSVACVYAGKHHSEGAIIQIEGRKMTCVKESTGNMEFYQWASYE